MKPILRALSSIQLTLACLLAAMVLVGWGTVAQVHLGTYEAQKEFFNSAVVFVHLGNWTCPVFPGGLTIGAVWLVNLVVSFITRFRLKREDLGINITHAGIILLLLGQLFTQALAKESQMPIQVGQSKNYSEDFRSTELVFIKTSDPDLDEVTSVPDKRFFRRDEIHPPRLPFYFIVQQAYKNAQLAMTLTGETPAATQGIGARITARELPPITSEDQPNSVTAVIEIREGSNSLGTWLVSSGLGAPQSFHAEGAEYSLAIRPRRYYYPFTLTLKEFHHDIYPGTQIPKNFSSLVELSHPQKHDRREALIYMNHPLRYEGKTFYQASFGEGDTLSVLQVVANPASLTPYVSCLMVAAGLLIQFLSHLFVFVRRPR